MLLLTAIMFAAVSLNSCSKDDEREQTLEITPTQAYTLYNKGSICKIPVFGTLKEWKWELLPGLDDTVPEWLTIEKVDMIDFWNVPGLLVTATDDNLTNSERTAYIRVYNDKYGIETNGHLVQMPKKQN